MKDYLWRSVFMSSVPDHRNHPWCFQKSAAMLALPDQAFFSGCWHKWFSRSPPPPPPPPMLHLQQHSLCILTINNWLSFSLPCFTSASMFRHLSVGGTCLVKLILACSVFGLQKKINFWWCFFVYICFYSIFIILKVSSCYSIKLSKAFNSSEDHTLYMYSNRL